ncbi:exo-beta-N-acetylmuramidase NamZ domain-containing protein [Bacteroidota bacterium]
MQKSSIIKFCSFLLITSLLIPACKLEKKRIKTGAERVDQYIPLLKGKNLAVLANHTSLIANTHLIDSLIALNINLVSIIFTPEHGFRGNNDAGEYTENYIDGQTGIKVVSLYGEKLKPEKEDLTGIDIVIVDLQDVGARFYTYISTMHYMMEACAENGVDLIVFDRPNPNGFYIDGPVLDPDYKSFVGMHPVPIVHGMTIGEYAKMINGEGWLNNGVECSLKIIECENYTHNSYYEIPVKPSPNLPNMTSILLYPGLCLFEGSIVSIGRGTDYPFQVIGHPDFPGKEFFFKPVSIPGASKYPKLEGEICYGIDLREMEYEHFRESKKIELSYLISFYNELKTGEKFFNSYFDKLAGTDVLRKQILSGETESEIRKSWETGIKDFKTKRKQYLLYKDFE